MEIVSKRIQQYLESGDFGENSSVRHHVHNFVTTSLRILQQGQRYLRHNIDGAYAVKVFELFHFATSRLIEAQDYLSNTMQGPDEHKMLKQLANSLYTRSETVLEKGIVVDRSLEGTVRTEELVQGSSYGQPPKNY